MRDNGVRKVKEVIAFTLCMLVVIFIFGFVICVTLIACEVNQIILFIVGVLGGILVGWVFSSFWFHDILEED